MDYVEKRAVQAMLSLSRPPFASAVGAAHAAQPAVLPNTPDTSVLSSSSPPRTPGAVVAEPLIKPPRKMSLASLLTCEAHSACAPWLARDCEHDGAVYAAAAPQHATQRTRDVVQDVLRVPSTATQLRLPSFNHLTAAVERGGGGGVVDSVGARAWVQSAVAAHAAAGMTAVGAQHEPQAVAKPLIVKRPYKKYYSNPTPSSHCHVCARTSKAVRFATCARIRQGLCRKVTCHKCFIKFGWDWKRAINDVNWLCVHCRGECPEGRSQCFIYARVNRRRGSKRRRAAERADRADRADKGVRVDGAHDASLLR